MLARRIMSHGPSTAKPPRCTIASTPLVTRRMSAMRATSPGMDFSPAASFFTGLMSESRRLYLPASSRRRCVPTSPAAPVMRMVFIDSCSELLPRLAALNVHRQRERMFPTDCAPPPGNDRGGPAHARPATPSYLWKRARAQLGAPATANQRMPFSINGTSVEIVFGVTTSAPVLMESPANPYFFES